MSWFLSRSSRLSAYFCVTLALGVCRKTEIKDSIFLLELHFMSEDASDWAWVGLFSWSSVSGSWSSCSLSFSSWVVSYVRLSYYTTYIVQFQGFSLFSLSSSLHVISFFSVPFSASFTYLVFVCVCSYFAIALSCSYIISFSLSFCFIICFFFTFSFVPVLLSQVTYLLDQGFLTF